ncbi:MAG: hypothetical protein HY038_04345 [Nitrospirae bacterium]|nr:hypothetical protein [Nitrospirota bacterium]
MASPEAATIQSEPVETTTSSRMWERLLTEAEKLHLPTTFLRIIPPEFVRFEFDDLRSYAAEYHPGEHRMILDRSLSFNAAGGMLKPLTRMTHKELEVLYHELFHAYMDYLAIPGGQSVEVGVVSKGLMDFARKQQACRYGEVAITPIVQRKDETESRYLSESESWEALNETWAVFVGWAIWNQLEVQKKGGGTILQQPRQADQWIHRFEVAVQRGELRGYYVPEDSDERRVAQKRFLAKRSQLSWQEVVVLVKQVLGFPDKFIGQLKKRPGLLLFIKQTSIC